MQDYCTVCAERTIGTKINLDAPMELLGDVGHMGPCFGLFGNSVIVSARKVHGLHKHTLGSEIILDAHNGTAR
jgi:hypothetical protein